MERIIANQDKTTFKNINVPVELKKSYIDVNITDALREISKKQKLSYIAEKSFSKLCFEYLYQFSENTTGFIQKLELMPDIKHEMARELALKFKENILDKIIKSLKYYDIDLNKENIFFEANNLKVSDRYIYYSSFKQRQPIINVSHIDIQKKFLSPKYILYFEVFIPQEGGWGTVDRPSFVLSKEDAIRSADRIEKAIHLSEFILMNENILT